MLNWESSELFKQLVDALPVGLYITDINRKLIYWNHSAERISGYLSQEMLGRFCHDDLLVHCLASGPPVCDTSACPLRHAMRDGKPYSATFFLRHKHGHRLPVRIQAIPLRNEHGAIVAVAELFQEDAAIGDAIGWEPESRLQRDMGIANAEETREHLRRYLVEFPSHLGVYLITVDQLQEIKKMRGSEMVRVLLESVAQSTTRLPVVPYFFGWWTRHRFLLLVPNCSPELFQEILKKLQGVGSACGVKWWGDWVVPHVLVNAVLANGHDSLETLLNHIDPNLPAEKLPAGDF